MIRRSRAFCLESTNLSHFTENFMMPSSNNHIAHTKLARMLSPNSPFKSRLCNVNQSSLLGSSLTFHGAPDKLLSKVPLMNASDMIKIVHIDAFVINSTHRIRL